MKCISILDLHKMDVAVLGDVMVDRFVYGSVERISPEAPIPVLLREREAVMLGGAGNVARNIAALGGCPVLIGMVGCDENGESLAAKLAEESGVVARLIAVSDWPTIVKTRFVAGTQQIMRLDLEQRLEICDNHRAALLDLLRGALTTAQALVLSDYGKGLLTSEIVTEAISAARAAGVPVIVDPKARDFSLYAGADVVTPNAREAENATGIDCQTDAGAAEAAKEICETSGIAAVIVTRGAQGMTLYAPQAGVPIPLHIPTSPAEVFDVSGAGDTVVATLALFLAGGEGIENAARAANVAAGIVVSKAGTALVRADELAHSLDSSSIGKTIVPRSLAALRAAEWRAAKLKIGFANGCYDLIHPGHVKLLESARGKCDRLIVALNSDASVQRMKGKGRPVQNEAARTVVMAAIRSVDLVTVFDEDTPLNLIEEIRPDVLIKGADYELSEVVGADLVQSWGGTIVLIPLEEGNSTSNMINRAKSN